MTRNRPKKWTGKTFWGYPVLSYRHLEEPLEKEHSPVYRFFGNSGSAGPTAIFFLFKKGKHRIRPIQKTLCLLSIFHGLSHVPFRHRTQVHRFNGDAELRASRHCHVAACFLFPRDSPEFSTFGPIFFSASSLNPFPFPTERGFLPEMGTGQENG